MAMDFYHISCAATYLWNPQNILPVPYLLHGNTLSHSRNNLLTSLLLVGTYLHVEENFVLCIEYWTGAKRRLRWCYIAAIFCIYKVSFFDWIGNVIILESRIFAHNLVILLSSKFQISQSVYTYIRGEIIIKLINLNMFVY